MQPSMVPNEALIACNNRKPTAVTCAAIGVVLGSAIGKGTGGNKGAIWGAIICAGLLAGYGIYLEQN